MKENKEKFNFCACFNCWRQNPAYTIVYHYLYKESNKYFCKQDKERAILLNCELVSTSGEPYLGSNSTEQFKVITGLIKFNQENEK